MGEVVEIGRENKSLHDSCGDRVEQIRTVARFHCMYNSVSIAQVVRIRVVDSGGLYVATSADVPTMHASAFDRETLRDAIGDSIYRYFFSMGDDVRVVEPAVGGDDSLTTWEAVPLRREAAE
jgi:hypothetical protein